MLRSIHIRNFVLIESLDLELCPGFSVMTGQTGAGKSILLDALNLIMGQRSDIKVIRQGASKCSVECSFQSEGYGLDALFKENDLDYDPQETLLRREISQTGKSRAFINDTPVTLAQMKEIASRLIDIHSQHQNLVLGTEQFQMGVVDTLAANDRQFSAYRDSYFRYNELQQQLKELREQATSTMADQEYLTFQLEGLDSARLKDGEQEELESELDVLSHAEEIKGSLYQAENCLESEEGGALGLLRSALSSLKQASRNSRDAAQLVPRIESSIIELKDILSETAAIEEQTNFDPARLEAVSARLDLIYSLEKKHRKDSIAELIAMTNEIRAKLDRMDSYDEDIRRLEKECVSQLADAQLKANALTATRKKASEVIEKEISAMLVPLGIPNVRFTIEIEPRQQLDRTGADCIRFMFSANRTSPMQDIAQVASGGEIARVMLSVKSLIAGATAMPTIIFDEIDTGVSGAVAEQMALLMRRMCADQRQVIAITHLPQIAAQGGNHYRVVKEDDESGTRTDIQHIDGEERVMEIAQMMSGSELTKAAIENARTLLKD